MSQGIGIHTCTVCTSRLLWRRSRTGFDPHPGQVRIYCSSSVTYRQTLKYAAKVVVQSHFGFDGNTLVRIVPVPGYCVVPCIQCHQDR